MAPSLSAAPGRYDPLRNDSARPGAKGADKSQAKSNAPHPRPLSPARPGGDVERKTHSDLPPLPLAGEGWGEGPLICC
jgi:hypothetical protein